MCGYTWSIPTELANRAAPTRRRDADEPACDEAAWRGRLPGDRHGGRGRPAARPLVQAARADALARASREDLPQGRGAGRRQARRDLDAPRRGADNPHPAAQSGGARGACGVGRQPRGCARAARHDALRGRRRARPQQALRPRGAGRLGHDAPHRRNAGLARQGRQPACACAPARPRHERRDCSSPRIAEPPRRSGKPFARGRPRRSTGRSWKARPSYPRVASRFISPRGRAWGTSEPRGNRGPARPAT